jgi:hypothetical protein
MPVALLAPHSVNVRPEGMPILTKHTPRDVNPDLMAREIAAALTYEDEAGTIRRPRLVIHRLHRKRHGESVKLFLALHYEYDFK